MYNCFWILGQNSPKMRFVMENRRFKMKFTLLFLLAFLFVACSDDTKKAQSIDTEQNVSIEQSDEKTEVNDTNVPLPVSEPTTLLKIQNLHLNLFRQGGGVKNYESIL